MGPELRESHRAENSDIDSGDGKVGGVSTNV